MRGTETTDIYSPTGRELQQRNRINEQMLISPSDSHTGDLRHPPSIYTMREKGVASQTISQDKESLQVSQKDIK